MSNLKTWVDNQEESHYTQFEWGLICEMSRQIEMQEFMSEQLEIEAERDEIMTLQMLEMMDEQNQDNGTT